MRESTNLVNQAGGTSPQTGRHRESIPGPPDPRTEALPTALTRPVFNLSISRHCWEKNKTVHECSSKRGIENVSVMESPGKNCVLLLCFRLCPLTNAYSSVFRGSKYIKHSLFLSKTFPISQIVSLSENKTERTSKYLTTAWQGLIPYGLIPYWLIPVPTNPLAGAALLSVICYVSSVVSVVSQLSVTCQPHN